MSQLARDTSFMAFQPSAHSPLQRPGRRSRPGEQRRLADLSRGILAAALTLMLAACQTTNGPAPTGEAAVHADLQTATAAPTQTASPAPSETPQPPTPTATVSPTPAPSLRQLTQGGCCTGPFWSPDGSRVLFIDRPSEEAQAGIWGVDLAGGPPHLVTERVALYAPDMQLMAYPQNGVTVIERPADNARWTLDNGARQVAFSPDGQHVAWSGGQSGPPFDTARRQVWVSRFDGSQTRQLLTVYGGGVAGWHPDGRLLVSGRPSLGEQEYTLWAVPIDGGEPVVLLHSERIRRLSISPQGGWIAYQVTFSDPPAANGLWLADLTSGGQNRLDLFGGYRWRDEGRLLVIPMQLGALSHQLWQVDPAIGALTPLTDPAVIPFKVANGDWSVSPDGRHVVFVSAADHNLWLLTLNP